MPLPGYSNPNNPSQTDVVSQPASSGPPASPNDINPVRSLDDIALVGSQLLNQGNVAEGTSTPPSQSGDFRVPRPSGFKVTKIEQFTWGQVHVVCTWQDIDPSQCPVSGYRFYIQNAMDNNTNPTLVGQSTNSPGHFCVPADFNATKVTAWLQPFLNSGLTLPLSACPTTTFKLPQQNYTITLLDAHTGANTTVTINNNELSGGPSTVAGFSVTDASGNTTTVASDFVVVINGTNNKPCVSMARSGGPGVVRVFDGTGAGGLLQGEQIFLDGSTARISLWDSVGSQPVVVTPNGGGAVTIGTATSNGSLNLIVNGVTFRIPYFT